MKERKNIDRLFQEKFKDFEAKPGEHIWENIYAELHPEKKRRIIPIWLKYSGIASGVLIGLLALNTWFKNGDQIKINDLIDENQIENTISNTENDKKSDNKNENTLDRNNNSLTQESVEVQDVSINSEESVSANQNQSINQKTNGNRKTGNTYNTVTGISTTNSFEKLNNKSDNILNQNNFNNSVHHTQNEILNPAFVQNQKDQQKWVDKKWNKDNQQEESISDFEKTNNNPFLNFEKNNIQDAVTHNDPENTNNQVIPEENELEKLLQQMMEEDNNEQIVDNEHKKWQVSSVVAPVYFNSASSGSPLDAQFADNAKSYDTNMSFGVGLDYAINKKLSVRTGVNKVTLAYDTKDVVFFASIDQGNIKALSAGNASAANNIQVMSISNIAEMQSFDSGFQSNNYGYISQKMGYIEIPIEMTYKLIDSKFGVNVIGGMSTLFLNENNISVASSLIHSNLGKAQNLNDVHFSTNIGVGFKYEIVKNFNVKFEPMFKYQINAFSKDAGNFKPYFIGLYSGLSFNF